MMTSLALSRKQLLQLSQIVEHFKEVEWFTIEDTGTSAIGPTMQVSFKLFDDVDKDVDTVVDITDVSTW